MEWMRETAAGDWIRDRLDASTVTGAYVPGGFEAYARVFHPVFRERPVGVQWPDSGDEDAWERFAAAGHEIDTESVTWRQVADALGSRFDALDSWGSLSAVPGHDDLRDGAGWRYQDPDEGTLDPGVLTAVARALTAHTETPDDGFAAVWDGWGGLVGARAAPSGVSAVYSESGIPEHHAVLRASFKDAFNAPLRKAGWRPGVLSDEISRGPRLDLPTRSHVLFRAAPTAWADDGWPETVPWNEPDAPWLHSPSLIWPDDRAWVVVTEVDADSTIVGGTAALIRALEAADGVEASEVPEGAGLE